ncbi:glycosyltransferase [Confluentibacter citreus]|uniref:glycosyltransferase n=1 Tax=Confluentibacter citreus TaxID=2007307 RepID=UPI000C28A23F|nr:glycosyltransferase [Confluentibacter citreus]
MNSSPLVSIILPLYNGEKYVRETIESILLQSYTNFEFIIINDGSTDNSLNIVKGFNDNRIVLIDQENKGLAATLNIGLNLANGDLIARIDSDDIAKRDRIQIQVNTFKKNPNLVLLGSAVNYIDENGVYLGRSYPITRTRSIKKHLLNNGNIIAHPSVMYIKDIVLKIGGYSEIIGKYFEDHFLWCQLLNYGDIENLSECLIDYRLTPQSISGLEQASTDFNEKILSYINSSLAGNKPNLKFLEKRSVFEKQLSEKDKLMFYKKRVNKIKKKERLMNIFRLFLPSSIEVKALIMIKNFMNR